MITSIRHNPKEFDKSTTLNQMQAKAFSTIHKLCEELKLVNLEDKIITHYSEKNTETMLKLLLRCKELFVVRVRAIKIMSLI